MGRQKGMTIAETVLAFGLMSVLALVVIGVFSKLLTATAKSSDQTAGQMLARSVLDRAVREGPRANTLHGNADFYTHDKSLQTAFVYEVDWSRVTNSPPVRGMGDLYQVDVVVTWWREQADARASRREVGRLSTEATRTVFIRR